MTRRGLPPAAWVGLLWVVVLSLAGDDPCARILAIVTVLLAAAVPAERGEAHTAKRDPNVVVRQRRRVLVASGDARVRAGLREAFEGAGYVVATAADAFEALAQADRVGAPDVVVLDLAAPATRGWEYCDAARRDPVLAVIPIVVLAAPAAAVPETAPVVARVASPVDGRALLEVIDRCERRAWRELGPRGAAARCPS